MDNEGIEPESSDLEPVEIESAIVVKRCPRCKESKDVADFARSKGKKDGYQTYCRACVKEQNHEYYLRTPEKNYDRRLAKYRAQWISRRVLNWYLSKHPCVDCGETDRVVMEFDHVRGEKRYNISEMVSRGFGYDSIMAEIEKCEVVCANCHRRRTARRAGWGKGRSFAAVPRTFYP